MLLADWSEQYRSVWGVTSWYVLFCVVRDGTDCWLCGLTKSVFPDVCSAFAIYSEFGWYTHLNNLRSVFLFDEPNLSLQDEFNSHGPSRALIPCCLNH